MPDLELAVFDILTNDGTVAALVSTRVYPNVAPQDAALPLLVYQRLSANREYAHDGEAGYARARIQVTCMDDDFSGVKALVAAVRGALSGYRATVVGQKVFSSFLVNEFDTFTRVNGLHTVRCDFMMAYAE